MRLICETGHGQAWTKYVISCHEEVVDERAVGRFEKILAEKLAGRGDDDEAHSCAEDAAPGIGETDKLSIFRIDLRMGGEAPFDGRGENTAEGVIPNGVQRAGQLEGEAAFFQR